MEALIINDVSRLIAKGWDNADAMRATAAKHDIPDYEVAFIFLDIAARELVSCE